jgi:hypothetical protein
MSVWNGPHNETFFFGFRSLIPYRQTNFSIPRLFVWFLNIVFFYKAGLLTQPSAQSPTWRTRPQRLFQAFIYFLFISIEKLFIYLYINNYILFVHIMSIVILDTMIALLNIILSVVTYFHTQTLYYNTYSSFILRNSEVYKNVYVIAIHKTHFPIYV